MKIDSDRNNQLTNIISSEEINKMLLAIKRTI